MAVRSVGTPTEFKKPEYYNEELLEHIDDMSKDTKGKFAGNKTSAQQGTEKIGDRAKQVSGESLYKDQNTNVAKGESSKGMINDKDYSTTLRLARMADAYNNKPMAHIMSGGTHLLGGLQDLGAGYARPQISTMETRAAQQALDLDTQRKQAMQQLQAAVDAKDYDTFKAILAQNLGIELNDAQAKYALDQYALQLALQDVTAKNRDEFVREYARYFDTETATVLYNMVSSNEPWAMQLAGVLEGQVIPPSKQDQFAADFIDGWLRETKPETSKETIAQYNKALMILQENNIKYDVESKAMAKVQNSWLRNTVATVRQAGQALPDLTDDPYK
ncbi:MAG: hypothetical protein IKQ22_03965 [Clostridia bacterium]|nr:hypothetical protein [Clostridia bacterium]